MLCAIWYHLCNFKNVKNTHGGVWRWSKVADWIVCSYHVTCAFHGESTLYSCLNAEELLARNRREIWSLSDCNGTRTHNHLVRKRTLKRTLNGWVLRNGCGFESSCRLKPITLLKVSLLHWCFSRVLNCTNGDYTNGTKSRKASQIINVLSDAEVLLKL